MTAIAKITKLDHLDRLIAHATAQGFGHHAELFRQVRAGRINMVQLDRGGVPPMRVLKRSLRPVLTLISDDDYASSGPSGWPALSKLLQWAAGAVIHGTGADIASYRLAADMAVTAKRFVLIETASACLPAWTKAFDVAKVPYLALRPNDGLHPLPLDRSGVQ